MAELNFPGVKLWPFRPAAPCAETLEWLSDVMVGHSGAEQRVQLRQVPRQTLRYRSPIPPKHFQRAENLLLGNLTDEWGVPIWVNFVDGVNVTIGQTEIICPTEFREWRSAADGLGASLGVAFKDPENYEIFEISGVLSDRLQLVAPIQQNLNDAKIMPLRRAIAPNETQRLSSAYDSTIEIEFSISDPFSHPAYSVEIPLTSPGLTESGELQRTLINGASVVDFNVGTIFKSQKWKRQKQSWDYHVLTTGLADIWAQKRWLATRAGRAHSFSMPTWEDNWLLAQAGLVGTTLRVRQEGFDNSADYGTALALRLRDNSWIFPNTISRQIVAANTIEFEFASALNVDAGQIQSIFRLGNYRLNADRIEINWVGNMTIEASLPVIEVSS